MCLLCKSHQSRVINSVSRRECLSVICIKPTLYTHGSCSNSSALTWCSTSSAEAPAAAGRPGAVRAPTCSARSWPAACWRLAWSASRGSRDSPRLQDVTVKQSLIGSALAGFCPCWFSGEANNAGFRVINTGEKKEEGSDCSVLIIVVWK